MIFFSFMVGTDTLNEFFSFIAVFSFTVATPVSFHTEIYIHNAMSQCRSNDL